MKLFLANCTDQAHVVNYRLLEAKGVKTQDLPSGGQIQIAGDLNTLQINDVIEQLRKYGLFGVDELTRSTPGKQVPWIYSVDRRIHTDVIRRFVQHNRGVLRIQGQEARRQAAVVSSNIAEQYAERESGAGRLEELEVTVQEEDSNSMGSEQLAEGIIVNRNAPPTSAPPTKQPRRARAKRAA